MTNKTNWTAQVHIPALQYDWQDKDQLFNEVAHLEVLYTY